MVKHSAENPVTGCTSGKSDVTKCCLPSSAHTFGKRDEGVYEGACTFCRRLNGSK